MSSKLIQKFLIFIFITTFFVILMIGIGRARRVSIQRAIVPIVPVNTSTSSATTTAQKESSASQPPPSKEPAITPPVPVTSNTTQEPPAAVQPPPPVKQKPKNLKFTGTTYGTPFGKVTVSIDISNGKLISVDTPDYPDSGPSIYARPYLIDQALNAGSANIQGVSGATYTSFAFQHSLESAIVSAGNNIF